MHSLMLRGRGFTSLSPRRRVFRHALASADDSVTTLLESRQPAWAGI